jgi:GGDEF domain-containing protein
MKRIRLPVAVLIMGLFLFYSIERVSKSVNISQVAYIFLPAAAALMLLVPALHKVNVWLVLGLASGAFLALEAWLGNGLGVGLPLLVTQVVAIVGTLLLARRVSMGVHEFEHSVVNISLGHFAERRTRQGEIYREVQRARAHHRPLMLVALKADEASVQVALDRMVQEAQQAMIKQYVQAGISKVLSDELDDYNIVARRRDHFILVLPEMTSDKLPGLLSRLRKVVTERTGVTLKMGTASLSKDLTTFDGLIERAVETMEAEEAPARPARPTTLAFDSGPLAEGKNERGDSQSL